MKDILIHVRQLHGKTPAAYFGVKLAAGFGASATGVYVYPAPMYFASAYEPELLAAIMQNARQLERDALQARQPFLDFAESLGVPNTQWIVAEGDADHALAQAATRHDLLVLDHPQPDETSAWEIADLILKVGTPCLVAPRRSLHLPPIERVTVGWNGSPEAMRALHAALPIMQGKAVLLLSGEVREMHQGVTWKTPFDVCNYLQRHGITVEQHAITAAPEDAGEAILEEAKRFRSDLLVMGAYGRNRFNEWLLGGATRHVLQRANLPLLLQH